VGKDLRKKDAEKRPFVHAVKGVVHLSVFGCGGGGEKTKVSAGKGCAEIVGGKRQKNGVLGSGNPKKMD